MIRGDKICLTAIERGDLSQLLKWRNDLRVNFRQFVELNMANQEAWFDELNGSHDTIMFAIRTVPEVALAEDTTRLLGACGWTYIDWKNRKAEASIYIGEEAHRHHGHGGDALRLLMRYGFEELGLHRAFVEVFEFNTESIKLFESAGFHREGVFRERLWRNGQWHNSILFSILQNEYYSPS